MKVFFPFYQLPLFTGHTAEFARWLTDSADFQRREHQFLATLSHPNIVRTFDAGDLILTAQERRQLPQKDVTHLPVLITDFIEGTTLGDAISQGLSGSKLTFVLVRIGHALEYLHAERGYLHADLKPANIIVRSLDSEPILIDFALAKNLNFAEVDANEKTRLLGDWDLFPKELGTDHRLRIIKQSEGTRLELQRLAFPSLDLFQFGKLLQHLQPQIDLILEVRESQYIKMLAQQLTDWQIVCHWGPRDLAPRLDRLSEAHFATFGVPELITPTAAERTIVIPPGVGVPLTPHVERVVDTRSFRRLAHINQLSMVGYVYPGADYKRSVHVLYAYELARQFVTHLYGDPLFRMLFDKQSVQQLLITVMLHDINHFPFLHILQESKVPGLNNLDVIGLFCNGEATGEKAAGQQSIEELMGEIGLSLDRFRRLVLAEHHRQEGPIVEVDQTISSLINSGVDVDKLSYLGLDSHFTGVRYGAGIDLQTLLKAAVLGRKDGRPDGGIHIGFNERAIQAVENVVMTRFWNFRAIYWHHTNRALMAMILQVVRELYVAHKRDVQEYLLDTMWRNDIEALRYLDGKYEAQLGKPSVLAGIVEDRSKLYKRIYTVRPGFGDDVDEELHTKLRNLDHHAEVRFRRALAIGLNAIIGISQGVRPIQQDEVLVDVPRREMDSGGAVYIATERKGLVPLQQMSEPIHAISRNYDALTKRVRVFLAPRVAHTLSRGWKTTYRGMIQSAMQEALESVDLNSQVK
jgi:HD superfamily phosphohydrolase